MISKSLYYRLISRVIILVAAALALGWILTGPAADILAVIPVLLLVATSVNIIRFLNRINRRIFYFFDALRNDDSSLSFPEADNSRIEHDLNQVLFKVNEQIKHISAENRKQELYFQALIEHAATGMFTLNHNGFIIHSNRLAKQLFGLEQFTHLSQLENVDHSLYTTVREIQPSQQRLVSPGDDTGNSQLLIKANSIMSGQEELMILSVQDIKYQLDEKELESWRKLIRVMMHEIMNTVSPITSLSESLSHYFYTGGKLKTPEQIDAGTIDTTIRGLDVIREQGKGLINFVGSYQELTRLPEPVKKSFPIQHLMENIRIISATFPNAAITDFQYTIDPPELKLIADEKLISQVLVNLVKNAYEANEKQTQNKVVVISKIDQNGHPEIRISDSGSGIPKDLSDKIFIPFFTTKDSGSGVGLSISRQIIQMHGGSLKIQSSPGEGTTAIITF